jgi:hypothetical protein
LAPANAGKARGCQAARTAREICSHQGGDDTKNADPNSIERLNRNQVRRSFAEAEEHASHGDRYKTKNSRRRGR